MRRLAVLPVLISLLACDAALQAQQQDRDSGPTAVSAASAVSADSSYLGKDRGLGVGPDVWRGPDAVPPVPAGMIGRAPAGDTAMMYFALKHRTGAGIAPGDADILRERQADLVRAAAFRGYDLTLPGWMYQQSLCPDMQPGQNGSDSGQGSLLLHFVRRDQDRVWAFTAVVPRDTAQPVRAIEIAHNSMEQNSNFLSAGTSGPVVNRAIAPSLLYSSLQPMGGWIAAGACIAELGGAYPHIPNEPSLSNDILTAPGPYLVLGLHGEREVRFTDRVDAAHYVVWDERISAAGKMDGARRDQKSVRPPRIEHPRRPKSHLMDEAADPPVKIEPLPPTPDHVNESRN